MSEATTTKGRFGEVRQKALREELTQLLDVVGPVQLIDLLLERSFQLRATDLHFDPVEGALRVRMRVDGLLHDVIEFPAEVMSQVVSRLKLMGNMDIAERRLPPGRAPHKRSPRQTARHTTRHRPHHLR